MNLKKRKKELFFHLKDLSAGKISQAEFFESLEISRTNLETALACLAPEEEGSEAARWESLYLE